MQRLLQTLRQVPPPLLVPQGQALRALLQVPLRLLQAAMQPAVQSDPPVWPLQATSERR